MSDEKIPENFIVLGHIARAHGVHGAVVITAYSENPENILSSSHLELLSPDGFSRSPVQSLKGKAAAQGLIVKIQGVSSREAAMALHGWRLGIERRYLPAAADDEVYLADLIGLSVFTSQGELIGKIENLMEAGTGLLLVVKSDTVPEREILLPFHEEFVRSLDMASGRLVFDPPPGLLDL